MQALCAFAHASEVSVRENQRIRWRIVHGGDMHLATITPVPLRYRSCHRGG